MPSGVVMKDAGLTGPRKIKACDDDELRACGLSSQKIRYARKRWPVPASAIRNCGEMASDTVIDRIDRGARHRAMDRTDICDVFAWARRCFCPRRTLPLQEAARLLFELDARPRSEKEMRDMALEWSPWRGVAAQAALGLLPR